MSERERWIVYPLLFFALGTALREKIGFPETRTISQQMLAGQVVAEVVRTKQLVIVNDQQVPLATLGINQNGSSGQLQLMQTSKYSPGVSELRYIVGVNPSGGVDIRPPLTVNIPGMMLLPTIEQSREQPIQSGKPGKPLEVPPHLKQENPPVPDLKLEEFLDLPIKKKSDK
ncbi:MAG: hypothetical protein SFX18_00590 [Pirellulales bacterium]|nr:hypothetical protein [Pirellulales bacterium]